MEEERFKMIKVFETTHTQVKKLAKENKMQMQDFVDYLLSLHKMKMIKDNMRNLK